MKHILTLAVLFASSFAFSATKSIKLDMKLTIDGRDVSAPVVVVLDGEKAMISQRATEINEFNETFIEVHAKQTKVDAIAGINMNFVISQTIDGKKKIISTPQIFALDGGEAEITVGSSNGDKNEMKFSVVPTIQ
ncbi:MAG: hypothetical protein SGJ18_15610 [Pseudomonadota bacterium]|nr:hypothetical protein [Pseudomonadota bacterium]